MALDTEFGMTSPEGSYFPMSPALPKMCGDQQHHGDQGGYQFTGSTLSPLLANRLLSPKTFLDLSRRVRRTGLTPLRGHPSPKFGPYPSPSPYRLRSQNNSPAGFMPKFQDLAFNPELMFGMRGVRFCVMMFACYAVALSPFPVPPMPVCASPSPSLNVLFGHRPGLSPPLEHTQYGCGRQVNAQLSCLPRSIPRFLYAQQKPAGAGLVEAAAAC